MTMTKKYKILGKYIKDMSSETPDIETYVFVRDYISKYQLNIDINSKTLKNLPEKVVKKRYKNAAVIKNVRGECSTFDAILVCLIISTSPVTDIKDVSFNVICQTLLIPGKAYRII